MSQGLYLVSGSSKSCYWPLRDSTGIPNFNRDWVVVWE